MKSTPLILLLFLISSVPGYSQSRRHKQAEPIPEDSVKVEAPVPVDSVSLLQSRIDSLEALLEKERSPLTRSERKELKKEITRLQKDSTQLQKAIADHLQTIEGLNKTMGDKDQEILTLKSQMEALEPVKEQWAAAMKSTYSTKWSSSLFSEISLDVLKKDIDDCNENAKVEPSLSSLAEDLSRLYSQVHLFQEGAKLVASPFNKEMVDALIPEFVKMEEDVTGTFREEEVQTVCKQLQKFETRIKLFQKIIQQVDQAMAEWDKSSEARPFARKVLKDSEEEMGYISAICAIPWLKEQYEAYHDVIEKDCKGKNPARDTIMAIELK